MPTLYVVATPIGNLGDMSPRAIETLRAVQLIAAEDTRVTMKLLNAFDISTPLTSCHEHNERSKAVQIAERMLAENIDVAVTTDAGTPCISDPGSVLVREATERGIPAVAVSGPTAMASALSVSGMDISEFTFYGFLPRQKNELREKLTDMARHSKIAVVHESPHRVVELLQQVQAVLPHTDVSASCDLTKKFEQTLRGPVEQVLRLLEENPKADKGEYCAVVDLSALPPMEEPKAPTLSAELFLMSRVLEGDDLRQAMDAAREQGYPRNELYRAKLKLEELFEEE